jgi:aerobic-type carbon monoxide dehydrogenase small subunit (CoxS/CutS family)
MPVYQLLVNGQSRTADVPAVISLLDVLRHEWDLTGTKYGCGEGMCGACTVLVDDQPVRACLTQVSTLAGKRIRTIEGLAPQEARLHRVQEAFLQQDAMQCGFCTAGMIMSAVALLSRQSNPTDNEIVRAMNANICRCGTHPRIVEAIKMAARGTEVVR